MSNLIQNQFVYGDMIFKTIYRNEKIYTEFNILCGFLDLSDSYYYKKFNDDNELKDSMIKEYVRGNHGLRKKIFIDVTYLDKLLKKLSNSHHNKNYFFIENNLSQIIKEIFNYYRNNEVADILEIKNKQNIKKVAVDNKEFFCFERERDGKVYLPLRYTIDTLEIPVSECVKFFQNNPTFTRHLKRIINNGISLVLFDIDILDTLVIALKHIDNHSELSLKIKNMLADKNSVKIPKTYVESLLQLLNTEDKNVKLEIENINLKLELDELKQKALMYDSSLSTVNLQDMKQISSVFGIGRNSLFTFLRERHVLMEGGEDHNLPYQKYIKSGYFIVRRVVVNRTAGNELKNQTLVTPKGVGFLNRIIKNNQTDLFNNSIAN